MFFCVPDSSSEINKKEKKQNRQPTHSFDTNFRICFFSDFFLVCFCLNWKEHDPAKLDTTSVDTIHTRNQDLQFSFSCVFSHYHTKWIPFRETQALCVVFFAWFLFFFTQYFFELFVFLYVFFLTLFHLSSVAWNGNLLLVWIREMGFLSWKYWIGLMILAGNTLLCIQSRD